MSVLVVGLSHKAAPLGVLERAALSDEGVDKLLADATACSHISEAVVLSTCNRIEVYAEVERFHGGVDDLTELLARHTLVEQSELLPYLYVRYEDGAVAHLFSVACGLDSMVVGETQILGQVKAALRTAQRIGTAGPVLNLLLQRASRVGKRAHSETELGRAGRSVVTAALAAAESALGRSPGRALIVGAGSMAALAATALRDEQGTVELLIAGRTPSRTERLASDVGGRAIGLSDVEAEVSGADLIVSCTGASETVLSYDMMRLAGTAGRVVVLDLAMPRDVDPAVAELPGVTVIGLEELAALGGAGTAEVDADAVRGIVADEVAAFIGERRAASAAPAVIALRGMATEVAEAELRRLTGRLPELDEKTYAEVERTVRRVVDKLLHIPTVRVKELAERPVQTSYADALRELFALDPATPVALEANEPGGEK